jgi:hypothetical protein
VAEVTVSGEDHDERGAEEGPDDTDADLLGAASAGLGALGFLTLLRAADRRERTPARSLGLWLAATAESQGAVLLGALAVSKRRGSGVPGRGVILGAAGVVLGSLSLVLNLNWLRTRRRV